MSLNSRGLCVSLHVFYIYSSPSCLCWKENKKKCVMMCIGMVMCSMSTIMPVCMLVCVCSFSLSVGAPCCGHFPSHPHRGFSQTGEKVFVVKLM